MSSHLLNIAIDPVQTSMYQCLYWHGLANNRERQVHFLKRRDSRTRRREEIGLSETSRHSDHTHRAPC
jgi:hypothetical protein